jgi:hypothetical protein
MNRPNNDDWRFEYKYRLSAQQYYQVRSAFSPYVRRDEYTLRRENKRYTVRSIYFDTPDLRALQEKINGDCDRTKLRIRTYASTEEAGSDIRVELKARKGITVEKRNTFITIDMYHAFMQTRHWPETADPVLIEFERYIHLKNLKPIILIEYLREGYVASTQKDLRITFDHNVRSAASSALFPCDPFFRSIHRNMVTFEIKCNKSQPAWLLDMVKQQGLRIVANSKFAQGVQISRPEIVVPSWSY